MAKIVKNKLGNFLAICLILLMVAGWIFSGWPQVWHDPPFPPKVEDVHATTRTIEQQINIIDQEYESEVLGSYKPTDNSLGLIRWDSAKYPGAVVYFEAVAMVFAETDTVKVALFSSDGTQVANSEVTHSSAGNYTRVRSSALTLGTLPNLQSNTDYSVRVKAVNDWVSLKAARLIIVQSDGTKITDTVTQIEAGDNQSTTATSGSPSTLANPNYYMFDKDMFSGTYGTDINAYFEASLKASAILSAAAYYFNAYDSGTAWTNAPAQMVDGSTSNFAVTGGSDENQRNTASTCDATCGAKSETITKVELRVYACQDNADNGWITLTPYFSGSSQGDGHTWSAVPDGNSCETGVAAWSPYFDITSDTNAPGTWGWSDVENLDVNVFGDRQGGADVIHAAQVDIQVTYEPGTTSTAYAELYNRTNSAVVGNSTISVNSTSWTRVRGASALNSSDNWDITNDDEYEVRIYSSSGSDAAYIANAKIVIEQSISGGIDKLETVHQYNNTLVSLGGDVVTVYAQLTISGGAAISGSKQSTGSGSYTRLRSSGLTLSTNDFDVELSVNDSAYTEQGFMNKYDSTNWVGGTFVYLFETILKNVVTVREDSSTSWLIIQISGLASIIATTTIGDGTDPSDSTVAPESGITDLDAVTFVTNTGTDSITAVTVTLGAGDSDNLSEVRITNDNGLTTYFSAISSPSSDTLNFSGGTPIPVTASSTQFKVRITPETHANMPAPQGAEYAITGTITAFTSTNTQAGTDTGSAMITIDNLSPNNATSTSGSVTSDTEITINWTTSNSTDYNRSIVLRWQASLPGADVPAEGTNYSLDDTIGGAKVACVENTGTSSTAYSGVDGSGADECSTTALSVGTQYSYKHFEKDDNGNWNTGFTNASSPLTTTGGATLTFSISDNDIFFGDLSASASKWADNTADGSTTAVVAHTLAASTNVTNGYTITVNGTTLTSGGDTIIAMASEAILTTGQEEFGLRITASGGNGTVDADYDNSPADSYALITGNFPDVIATDADGDDVSTTYSLYYAANITANTEAHTDYTSSLTYVATGNF
ncbi:hypothetical protein LCGC14_0103060 [marine sediment metagenome]|uniref:Uncharacterized protein n=1 Tax=marine sediment metagenome TaxID=412755 RepID=A0A0F9VCI1_9ZZZZ|nr:hypothetical protein [Candidatus Nealsonbacteria bacterium]